MVVMLSGMLSTLSILPVHAQQSGLRAASQSGAGDDGAAGTKGSGSGGTSAGAMSGQGSASGVSAGPGAVNLHRSGGPTAPEPPAPPPPPGTDTEPPALADSTGIASLGSEASGIYVLGRGGRCEGYELGRMSVEQRVRGENRNRLNAIQRYLAPGFQADDMQTPIYILANYQQELESARPNLTLAGTYLGLVATRRIDADVVTEVNNALCLAIADVQAESISQTAEAQRLSAP